MGVKLLFTRRILLTHYFKEDFIDSTTDTFEEIENQKKKGIEKLEERKFEEQKFHQEENAKLKHEVAHVKQGILTNTGEKVQKLTRVFSTRH